MKSAGLARVMMATTHSAGCLIDITGAIGDERGVAGVGVGSKQWTSWRFTNCRQNALI